MKYFRRGEGENEIVLEYFFYLPNFVNNQIFRECFGVCILSALQLSCYPSNSVKKHKILEVTIHQK